MEDNLIGIVLIVLGGVAVIGNIGSKARFVQNWFLILFSVFSAFFSFGNLVGFEDGEIDRNPLYLGISLLFFALLLSRFTQSEGKLAKIGWVGFIFPLVFLILGDKTFAFGGNGFTGLDLLKVGVLGAIAPLAYFLVFGLFRKVGFEVVLSDEPRIQPAMESGFIYLFLAGVGIAGYFLAGPFGVFVALVSYLGSSLLTSLLLPFGQSVFVPVVLLFVLWMPLTRLAEIGQAENLGLLQGRIFSGLFFGVVVVVFHSLMLMWAERLSGFRKMILLFKSIVLPVLFVLIPGMLYFAYESFGGAESVLALLIGAGLAIPLIHLPIPNASFGSSALLLGSAILFMPMFFHPTEEEGPSLTDLNSDTQKVVVVAEDGSQQQLDVLDLNEAKGNWVVNTDNSVLNFTLEASGSKTKGKFSSYTGKFTVQEDWKTANMEIVIPVKSISTFNKIRTNHCWRMPHFLKRPNSRK
jgi:hypothetical protein